MISFYLCLVVLPDFRPKSLHPPKFFVIIITKKIYIYSYQLGEPFNITFLILIFVENSNVNTSLESVYAIAN